MNGKDTVERAIATAVQALLAVGTAGAAPLVVPGLPGWAGALAGVVLAVAAAVAKSLGVSAQIGATVSSARTTVDAVADQVAPAFANTNIDMSAAGHAEAQTAAPARSVAPVITPVFDQPTPPVAP